MKCPKCDGSMEQIQNPFADFERCTSCKGLWLDMLEHEDLREVAEAIDIGDPKVGKKFNAKQNVYCPACSNSKLLAMVDPHQPHIWYESCPTCYGRFYDAGEFKDLSEHTFSDFVKDLFAHGRD